jgi:DNA-binding MarR family transcriptional regulator
MATVARTTGSPTGSKPSEPALDAWRAFLGAHSRLMRRLDAELHERHGYTLGDFDVLVHVGDAPRGRLRMCDLAAAVVLSPSGLSRRVDRLEREGLVKRERATGDARNVEARLTATGKKLLLRLRKTHRAGIKAHFADRYSPEELDELAELLSRLTVVESSP